VWAWGARVRKVTAKTSPYVTRTAASGEVARVLTRRPMAIERMAMTRSTA
jgi:hypothetical protein